MANRKSYLKIQIRRDQLAVILTAIGVVLLVVAWLFEVKVQPSRRAEKIKQLLGRGVKQIERKKLSYGELVEQVIPKNGKTVLLEWGNMGQKLVKAGAIDLNKLEDIFPNLTQEQKEVLEGDDLHQIVFREDNIGFWTDVLWALGLTQKSKVLSEGPMKQNEKSTPLKNYASTAGWTLGTRDAMRLYNSQRLIELTPEQDELVYQVASNIYRPCCGNSAAYPDCNHGMAVLGLLELMASAGASEGQMYEAALAFNSYAFADTYINAAAVLAREGRSWDQVEPKLVLGYAYSSGQGAVAVAKSVGEIPGAPKRGASCGV